MAKLNIKYSNHLKAHKMQLETILPNTKHELYKTLFHSIPGIQYTHCELVASTKIQINIQPLLHDNPKEIYICKAI